MNNDDEIIRDLLQRLKPDFGFKEAGKRLEKGKCPSCGKNELYTYIATPWILTCGRTENCGDKISVREHYPEIFDTWSNRFVASEKNPNAAADAYLSSGRGLSLLNLRGAYTQESYVKDKLTSATVRFPLPNNTWWERLIDHPGRFDKKARFMWNGSYAGYVWKSPQHSWEDLARAEEIWLTEGIFDTAALIDCGYVSVSLMSCNNWPEHFLAELLRSITALGLKKRPQLVWALDTGKAGTEYTRKFVEQSKDEGWKSTAAQPMPEGETGKSDWNDLKKLGQLKGYDKLNEDGTPAKGAKLWKEHYLWNGKILLVENAADKAVLIYEKEGWSSFSFVHRCKTYWANFDAAKIKEIIEQDNASEKTAASAAVQVSEIANCAFRTLYWQRDEATDDSQYFVRIDFAWEPKPYKASFSGGAITAGAEFKKRLASVTPGGLFEGNTRQLDRLFAQQNRKLKVVHLLDFMGYSRDHEAWVLDDYAVYKGRVVKINAEDYFDLGKYQLKLRSRDRTLSIEYDADRFEVAWLRPFYVAFRENGMVVLTFLVMSLFAEQIRRAHKSMGFLEMIGLPGTGKTTIIEFMWKLVGRDNYEGFDPAKSTLAAYTRNLSRVANLPAVFMEADRGEDQPHSKKFDWDEIKPLFNGRIGRARGVKNNGNETYEPPFRGALIIEQNYPVNGSPAVMERIMQLNFTKDGWTEATKIAANEIEQWPIEDISGTIIHLIKREADYLKTFADVFAGYEKRFTNTVKVRNARQRLIHAELHAGLDAMAKLMPIPADMVAATHAHIDKMAQTRDRSLESDHEIVAKFWEAYDYLESEELAGSNDRINKHRKSNDLIAVNLTDFEARCHKKGIKCPEQALLKKHLKTSKSHPFVNIMTVNTVDEGGKHCWVFQHPDAVKSKKGA